MSVLRGVLTPAYRAPRQKKAAPAAGKAPAGKAADKKEKPARSKEEVGGFFNTFSMLAATAAAMASPE